MLLIRIYIIKLWYFINNYKFRYSSYFKVILGSQVFVT